MIIWGNGIIEPYTRKTYMCQENLLGNNIVKNIVMSRFITVLPATLDISHGIENPWPNRLTDKINFITSR
jgi:hypothetical protein